MSCATTTTLSRGDTVLATSDTGGAYRRTMRVVRGMSAAVYTGEGRIEVQTLPVPEPGTGAALVEVSHCGICGTDLHLVLEQYARPGSVLGHEWSGTVAAAGDGVSTRR